MAAQRLAAVLPLVKQEARSLGLEFDENVPGAAEALRECLRAYRRAWQDISKRDEGEAIETPAAPGRVEAQVVKPSKLRDVLPQWIASKARKPATVKSAERALALYEEATGNPPIGSLTRAQGVDMRAFLLAGGVTAKTARDRFDAIKSFLNFAALELELIPKNPWTGLTIEYTTEKPRRPWTAENLGVLFSRPLFTAYAVPSAWDAGADAAYWMPLLAIYTGARVSELAQLRTMDVETVDGVPMLRITNEEAPGNSLKTDASRRATPLHSELIRLGFLEYVDALRRAGATRLWPALPLLKGKPGNYFSNWFNTTQREAPRGQLKLPDFHSFRHTARSKLASAKVSEPMMNVLIGHEIGGSEGARTYTHRTADDLREAIESLSYSVKLPRVYKAPVMTKARPKRAKGIR
jgi:integrase